MLNSRLVLLWGRNPMATNLHTVPILKEIRKRGGRVILIDPVRSESANFCDEHVQPRVATDAELAMAMAKVILEEGLEDRGVPRAARARLRGVPRAARRPAARRAGRRVRADRRGDPGARARVRDAPGPRPFSSAGA